MTDLGVEGVWGEGGGDGGEVLQHIIYIYIYIYMTNLGVEGVWGEGGGSATWIDYRRELIAYLIDLNRLHNQARLESITDLRFESAIVSGGWPAPRAAAVTHILNSILKFSCKFIISVILIVTGGGAGQTAPRAAAVMHILDFKFWF